MNGERDTPRAAHLPVPERMRRPVSVWVLTGVVGLIAAAGLLGFLGAYSDASGTGDEDVARVSLAGMVVTATLLACALGVFAGARWGRNGLAALCLLNFLGTVLGAMNETITVGAMYLSLFASIVVGFWALGENVDTWTGGDGSAASRRA